MPPAKVPKEAKERIVFYFCQSPKWGYVAPTLTFAKFKAGKAELLSFHNQHLPPDALRTAIDLFSTRLGDHLWSLNFSEKDGTRPKVRDAVRTPAKTIQTLLGVVAANYS